MGTVDLGEQEAVTTQTSPEENDQLIGLGPSKKLSRFLAAQR